MAGVEQREIEANGLRFETLLAGPESGEAVILLHGYPQSGEAWRDTRRLARRARLPRRRAQPARLFARRQPAGRERVPDVRAGCRCARYRRRAAHRSLPPRRPRLGRRAGLGDRRQPSRPPAQPHRRLDAPPAGVGRSAAHPGAGDAQLLHGVLPHRPRPGGGAVVRQLRLAGTGRARLRPAQGGLAARPRSSSSRRPPRTAQLVPRSDAGDPAAARQRANAVHLGSARHVPWPSRRRADREVRHRRVHVRGAERRALDRRAQPRTAPAPARRTPRGAPPARFPRRRPRRRPAHRQLPSRLASAPLARASPSHSRAPNPPADPPATRLVRGSRSRRPWRCP